MNYEENDTIDLMRLLVIIYKHLLLFIIVCLLTGGVAYYWSRSHVVNTYTTSAQIIVLNKEVLEEDVIINPKIYNNLFNNYLQIMHSDVVSETVVNNLELFDKYGIDSASLLKMYSVAATSGTDVASITVNGKDAELCAAIANEIAEVFKEEAYKLVPLDNITIMSRAKVPTVPSSTDNSLKNGVIGGLVGALLCGAYAVIVLLMDNRIKNEEDVKRIFADPILTMIPCDKSGKNAVAVSEAVLGLRTNLSLNEEFSGEHKVLNILANCDSVKSCWVAKKLAAAYSKLGKRVLVVDLELRHGSKGPGVVELCRAEVAFEEAVEVVTAGYDVLGIGKEIDDVGELLQSTGFLTLLKELKERYDLVFFVSSPLAEVSDGLILTKLADHSLLCLTCDKDDVKSMRRSKDVLAQLNIELLGIVLSEVPSSLFGC